MKPTGNMFSKPSYAFQKGARDGGLQCQKGEGFFSKNASETLSFNPDRWIAIRRWWFDLGAELADGGRNSDARGGAIGAPRQSSRFGRSPAPGSERRPPEGSGERRELT